MSAFIGRDVKIELILGKDTRAKVDGAYPKPLTPASYVNLGGTKGYSKNASWGDIDATDRSSKGNVRESIVDYLAVEGSIDGNYRTGLSENIRATKAYVLNPPSGQPYAWMRVTIPSEDGGVTQDEDYVLLTSFDFEAPIDNVGTYAMNYKGQQATITTEVPATT